MKVLLSILAFCFLFLSSVWADQLSWPDLLKQPEYRPEQCTIKKAMSFQNGSSVKAGQKMKILEFNPDEIVLQTLDGKTAFGTKPEDTDVLEVANATFSTLTPQQRALTSAEVLKRPELWPWKLKLKDTFDIGAHRLNKGDTVYLMAVEKGELVLVPSTFDLHFELKAEDTDLLEQARKNLETGAPGRIVEELDGKLINAQTGALVPLDQKTPPKYFVFYHAARWCPYSQKFTPGLIKLYSEIEKHPEYKVIYIPAEKSAAELQQYAKELNFPWPAVKFGEDEHMAVFAHILGRSSIPEFGVVDRYGNIIIDNAAVDRDTALTQLEALLKQK